MSTRHILYDRPQAFGEEVANAVSHGVALIASIAAIPVLVIGAARTGSTSAVVGAAIFGATLLLLYLSSMIYHVLPAGKAKRVFMVLDHCAIFLLIAGTYTPFTLGVLSGVWGWSLFGVVWSLALAGILLKSIVGPKYQNLSVALYLLMGWLVIVAIKPMLSAVPVPGLLWLLAGGLSYTFGVVFFHYDYRMPYAHFIWHLFVVLGSFCHFVAVFWYAV